MIKVTLLGDSIRLNGYGKLVPEILGENYNVFQPEDNCRFAQYTLRGLFDWEKDMAGSRIVYWNNGLWDVCDLFGDGNFTPLEEYVSTMLRIADILLSRYDKVIFATTTPVRENNPHNRNADIMRFNSALIPRLQEKGVIIHDLYSLIATDIPRYICEDTIHLSEEGAQVCGEQVAAKICNIAVSL